MIDSIKQLKEVVPYLNEEEWSLVLKAYNYAVLAYQNMKRVNGEDYIIHPLNTAYILTDMKVDNITLAAAILHDVLKNENYKIEDIEKEFGKEISSIVEGVYKITKLDFDTSKIDKINNQRKIIVGLCDDVRILIIKLAERLHNMRTLDVMPADKQRKKALETSEIYAPIAHGLGMSKIKSELDDLSLKYTKKEAYQAVLDKLDETKEQRDIYVREMMEQISNMLKENNIEFEIKGRSKSIYGIYKKLAKGKKFEDIYDILALRVFVKTIPECYQVMGIIHAKYKPIPKRFKDFIAMPKANMYQSLHTTVYGINDEMFEVQIRTYEMDEIAERGIASHFSYKEGGVGGASVLEQRLQFFRSILELNQEEENDLEFVKTVHNEMFKDVVYVYTPNGNVLELPKGSTPIDFAYRIHSDIGDTMVGAMVNGSIVPLDYELNDNDIVKINTNKNSKGPSYEWISFAKTTGAKNKIKSFFNKIDKEEKIKKGEEILFKELRKRKVSINDFLTTTNIEKMLKEFKQTSLDEIYINICASNIQPLSLINSILVSTLDSDSKTLEKVKKQVVVEPKVKDDIVVSGIDNIKVTIASCCRPVPGDKIVGYITKGEGIKAHLEDCPNIVLKSDRIIDVHWGDNITKRYPANIYIEALKNDHLLLDIVSKTSGMNITVQSMNTKNKGDYVIYNLTVLVASLEHLKKFMQNIESLTAVIKVDRSFA